jgi:hypothetical protein
MLDKKLEPAARAKSVSVVEDLGGHSAGSAKASSRQTQVMAQGDSLSDLRQRVRSDANVSTHRFVPRPHDARGHLPLESAAKATHIPAAALSVAPSSLDRCAADRGPVRAC